MGRWVDHPRTPSARWDVQLDEQAATGFTVAGVDLDDGERFAVDDVRFDGVVLRWRSIMPSTRRVTENELTVRDGIAEHRWSLVEALLRSATSDDDDDDEEITASSYIRGGLAAIESDPRLAKCLFEQAAGMGDVLGLYNFSWCYAFGIGCRRAVQAAIGLEREAARRGSINAMVALGYRLLNGLGVERDVDASIAFYKRAAAHGDRSARFSLGDAWLGRGDLRRARQHLRLAADADHPRAHYLLARMALRENTADVDEAAWHLLRAKQLGSRDAADFLKTRVWKQAVRGLASRR